MVGADGARERVASQSFGWRQPVAGLIAIAAVVAPLLAAFGWMISGAAGPLERRDPCQVPAFVAEESSTSDQPRTLVLSGTSPGAVSYALVRGSGSRLGDAELTAEAGIDPRLDKVVANLVAGSGADQTDELSGFAIRYVLVQSGTPHEMSRVLDATPGLSRLSQLDGSELWRVDSQISRAMIVSAGGEGDPLSVASSTVDARASIPAGAAGRILRIADTAAEGWHATLDGKVLPKKTVDGWAQGFELPAQGGRLALTFDDSITHTARIWGQGLLAVVLLVLALPGRRREIDDDLPEEAVAVPAQAFDGEGRRARRLRAAAEAEGEAPGDGADRDGLQEGDDEKASDPGGFETGEFGTGEFDSGAFGTGRDTRVPSVAGAPSSAGYAGQLAEERDAFAPRAHLADPADQAGRSTDPADPSGPETPYAGVPRQQPYDEFADGQGYPDAEYPPYPNTPYTNEQQYAPTTSSTRNGQQYPERPAVPRRAVRGSRGRRRIRRRAVPAASTALSAGVVPGRAVRPCPVRPAVRPDGL